MYILPGKGTGHEPALQVQNHQTCQTQEMKTFITDKKMAALVSDQGGEWKEGVICSLVSLFYLEETMRNQEPKQWQKPLLITSMYEECFLSFVRFQSAHVGYQLIIGASQVYRMREGRMFPEVRALTILFWSMWSSTRHCQPLFQNPLSPTKKLVAWT